MFDIIGPTSSEQTRCRVPFASPGFGQQLLHHMHFLQKSIEMFHAVVSTPRDGVENVVATRNGHLVPPQPARRRVDNIMRCVVYLGLGLLRGLHPIKVFQICCVTGHCATRAKEPRRKQLAQLAVSDHQLIPSGMGQHRSAWFTTPPPLM